VSVAAEGSRACPGESPPAANARALADEGRTAEALHALQVELAQRPPTADDFFLKASLLLAQGNRRAADDELGRALYLDPRHAEARSLRSAINHHRGPNSTGAAAAS
jgi:tetratricopeptide (TPR) repeat protein